MKRKNKKNRKVRKVVRRKRRNFRKPAVSVPREDVYLEEDTPVVVEDAFVSHPSDDEVQHVIHELDGFRDWERESRGNSLTYGDY